MQWNKIIYATIPIDSRGEGIQAILINRIPQGST